MIVGVESQPHLGLWAPEIGVTFGLEDLGWQGKSQVGLWL